MDQGANAESSRESPDVARGLFRTRDFLVPYLAESQSTAGDQIGRVALSILVFDRTGSAAWTAVTYALTYLPAILGGLVLGHAGDRFPHIRVMIASDILRAALFVCVAIGGLPLPIAVGLVAVAFFLGPAFTAANVSRLSIVLSPARFRAASGIRMITSQVAQVAGFAVGGIIVAAVHPRFALVLNAATFAFSALIVGVALRERPGPVVADPPPASVPAPATPRLLREPWLRHLMLLTALAAFFVVPEGLAVPLARELGASNTVAGLLLAAGPLGSAVGAAVLVKFVPHRRGMGVAQAMAIACGIPLVATALLPPWPVVLACWAVSGALWAYQVDVVTAVVHAVDERVRSGVVARASAVLLGAQGAGLIGFGAVGGWLGPRWGVSLAGLAGAVSALGIALCARYFAVNDAGGTARHRAAPASVAH